MDFFGIISVCVHSTGVRRKKGDFDRMMVWRRGFERWFGRLLLVLVLMACLSYTGGQRDPALRDDDLEGRDRGMMGDMLERGRRGPSVRLWPLILY